MELQEGSGYVGVDQHDVSTAPANNISDKWLPSSTTSGTREETPNGTSPPVSQVLHSMDPDELFFKSLLPDVQLLGPQQKGVFKLKVQQLLQEKLFPKGCDCSVTDHNGRSGAVTHSSTSQPNHTQAIPAYGTYGITSDRWSSSTNSGVPFCEYNKST